MWAYYIQPTAVSSTDTAPTRDYDFGTLGQEIKHKLARDNDAKVIIQGANSQTGIGKTTLAIQLCQFVDPDWNPKETGAYWNVDSYVTDYNEGKIPPRSAVLLDEIEALADNRRSTSHDNVRLTQSWARLRNRNVLNVVTLPTTSMLDKRLLELADYWILVRRRGLAQPYRVVVNDFNQKISRQPFDGEEQITFEKIPKSDPDYGFIEEMKTRGGDDDFKSITVSECEKRVEKAVETAKREKRNEMLIEVYLNSDLSYRDLAAMKSIDVNDPGSISRIVNDKS